MAFLMFPTLSIITINYNNRVGLQKTIDSVITQSFRDFEWIVIDGGSTDGSKELIEQFSDYISYWVSEPDKGIYNAMNKGVKIAKGDYLQFLNSGDWFYDETSLERCVSHGFTKDIEYGDLFFVDNHGTRERSNYPKDLTIRFFYKYSIGHNATFIRRELLQSELYDESYRIVSDWAFFLKQALNRRSFEYLDEIVTCFGTDGISSNNEEQVKQERQSVINSILPDMLIKDFIKMDEMERVLNSNHVKKVIEFGGSKKLYHKMITGCLLLIESINTIIKHRD